MADVPGGSTQIVRGPRPRSEQWPSSCHKVTSAQLSATSATPEADVQGLPAVDALKSELEKARQAAKAPPLNVQISSTQEFIRRSERRFADLEAERTAESKLLEEARERLRQLEASCFISAAHSAADGQSIAGRAGCVCQACPERPCGQTQSAPAVVCAPRCRRHHPTTANVGSTRAQGVDSRPSVRHARGHVVRELEKVVGVDVPRPGRRETRRDDKHCSMMS